MERMKPVRVFPWLMREDWVSSRVVASDHALKKEESWEEVSELVPSLRMDSSWLKTVSFWTDEFWSATPDQSLSWRAWSIWRRTWATATPAPIMLGSVVRPRRA
jgi:hypothetical protein